MKKAVLSAILAALCLLAACAGTAPAAGTSAPASQASASAGPSEAALPRPEWGSRHFQAVFTGADIGSDSLADTRLHVAITVPEILNAEENEAWARMNDSFSLLGESLLSKAPEWLGTPGLEPEGDYMARTAFTVTRSDGRYVSVRYDYYRNVDGGHASLSGATYDAVTGDPLPLAQLFTVSEDVFLPVLLDQMETLSQGKFRREDLEGYFDFNFFYLTDDALVVFYQENQLEPDAASTVLFEIPLADLSDILADWPEESRL